MFSSPPSSAAAKRADALNEAAHDSLSTPDAWAYDAHAADAGRLPVRGAS